MSNHKIEVKGFEVVREMTDSMSKLPKISATNIPPFPAESPSVMSSKTPESLQLPVNIPEIENLAQKLNKTSLFSLPDSSILNPSNSPEEQLKIRLKPKKSTAFKNPKHSFNTKKSRDPKFVPYEPYKGCVKPIFKKTNMIQLNEEKVCLALAVVEKSDQIVEVTENGDEKNEDDSSKLWKRLNETIGQFENEKHIWDTEKKTLELKNKTLKEELNKVSAHCSTLETQLATQSQVNCELKKLLVASVGEDVQSRVQCLTEDKARMSLMIRKYSEKVDRDYEDRERIGIQCDVWHSKFLATSLLLDGLAKSKAMLIGQMREAEEALSVLDQEHKVSQKQTLQTCKLLQQMRDAFDPLCSEGSQKLSSGDLLTCSVTAADLSEWLRDRLLGNLGRAVGVDHSRYENLEMYTPGEKMAAKVLENVNLTKEKLENECSAIIKAPLIHRFHPNVKYDHLTVNCCHHCNGDIKVV